MLEGIAGISVALKQLPADRLLVGTHAPFFAPEAGPLKLKESDLGEALRRQIAEDNAVKVLDWS
jgi:predicted TIM-barrel fold metal-dependent hydrolase